MSKGEDGERNTLKLETKNAPQYTNLFFSSNNTHLQALALFGIGGGKKAKKSDAKYEEDTTAVIAQVREVLDFPMGAEEGTVHRKDER